MIKIKALHKKFNGNVHALRGVNLEIEQGEFTMHAVDFAKRYGKKIVGISDGKIVLEKKGYDLSSGDIDLIYEDKKTVDIPGFHTSPVANIS